MFSMVPAIWRLLRFPNLIMVAITQYLILFQVIHPALLEAGVKPVITPLKFLEFAAITVAITASGYVINDIQDIEIDEINRPGANPVPFLNTDRAYWIYGSLLLGGYLISHLMAFRLGERDALWMYPLFVGSLAMYSVYLKRKPLMGNLIVAIYCGAVVGLVVALERTSLRMLASIDYRSFLHVQAVYLFFLIIAIVATMYREIIKDLQDIEGDRVGMRQTAPIIWGIPAAKYIAMGMGGLMIINLVYPLLTAWPGFYNPAVMSYIAFLVIILLGIMYQTFKAEDSKDYKLISRAIKAFLLGGLALIFLIKVAP
ncbi:UbiA family prenyltransferase [Lewinella sp. 4G2]|uniref:UbiA family prenyltransferase n=1 Tax=Lewinella sp. 4G2 TaxID=1803372 RepID=UPI0007B47442|nr:UbiA family prenyltransferase [Lewinella sp. 4G2]OAV44577.1 hypothetical protein A3850_008770 [Lewinella sp. 4G2]